MFMFHSLAFDLTQLVSDYYELDMLGVQSPVLALRSPQYNGG